MGNMLAVPNQQGLPEWNCKDPTIAITSPCFSLMVTEGGRSERNTKAQSWLQLLSNRPVGGPSVFKVGTTGWLNWSCHQDEEGCLSVHFWHLLGGAMVFCWAFLLVHKALLYTSWLGTWNCRTHSVWLYHQDSIVGFCSCLLKESLVYFIPSLFFPNMALNNKKKNTHFKPFLAAWPATQL